jgi:hypothetical protein
VNGHSFPEDKSYLILLLTAILLVNCSELFDGRGCDNKWKKKCSSHQTRKRHFVWGTSFRRWAQCTSKGHTKGDEKSFFQLYRKIKKYMIKLKIKNNKKKKDSAKNGPISSVVRLSIAIQFFAGQSI